MTKAWIETDEIKARPFGRGVSELQCPRCGEALLHHRRVRTFDRKEDAATVVETEIALGRVKVDPQSDGRDNPSVRRGGLIIDFECEGCGEDIELRIAQHKGSTEIGWIYLKEE